MCVFFFQAEDGIRDLVRSRGLGDVYKRQALEIEFDKWWDGLGEWERADFEKEAVAKTDGFKRKFYNERIGDLSLIHI